MYSALGLEHTLVFFPFFARDRALKNVSLRLPTSARRARSIYDEKKISSLLTSTTIGILPTKYYSNYTTSTTPDQRSVVVILRI